MVVLLSISRESLSRPKSLISKFMVGIEDYLLPYSVHYYGFKINMNRLRLYKRLIGLYDTFRRSLLSRAYALGLGLALEAIENGYEPREVRRKLLEIEQEIKVKGKVK